MNIKKMLSGVVLVVLIVTSLLVESIKINEVSGTELEKNAVIYEKMSIAPYRKGIFTAPVKKGYVFGGWFYTADNTEPLSDKNSEGEAYAKFVPEDVLKVYCQNSDGTNKRTAKTNVRLVTSVDTDIYEKVGFDITIYGTEVTKYNHEISHIYKKITISSGNDIISVKDNRLFSKASKYFVTLKMTNIQNSGFDIPYHVRAYWITQDGTKVYGPDKYARVRNGYDGSFSVPIRIEDANQSIAAALLSISYDNQKLVYEGYENGELFDECIARNNSGIVKILCGDDIMNKDIPASGFLGSLNFRVKDFDTEEEIFTFELAESQFCNVNEEMIDIDNVILKDISK